MSHDQARHAAEKMAKRLQKEFDLDYEWDGDVLVFERTGVNGELTVARGHVEIEVKLGFLLGMMKPTIEKHINENLDEIFAGHANAKPKKA
jgi:putative polyhydroxyalkanoate system protein